MNIFFWIIGLLIVFALHQQIKDSRDRKKFNQSNPPKPTPPKIPNLTTRHYCILDDGMMSLTSDQGGDSNSAQDILCSLAIRVSRFGDKPEFIGSTCTHTSASKDGFVKILRETALNIPVLEGTKSHHPGESELGHAIVAASKRGKFTVILGGSAQDLEWAFKNGAHVHNISIFALLRGTWNETGQGLATDQRRAMKQSANYVAESVKGRITEIRAPDYYHLIDTRNLLPDFRDTRAFIERNRKMRAWDVANTNHVLSENIRLNGQRFGKHTSGALRIADCLAMAEYCGVQFNDAQLMNYIQHGLDIIHDRVKAGAVNNIEYPPAKQYAVVEQDTRPIKASQIDVSSAIVHPANVTTNGLPYPETARLTSVSISENKYNVRHNKEREWSKNAVMFTAGRYITGNLCVVYYSRRYQRTVVEAIEYNVGKQDGRQEMPRPAGWSKSQEIQKGDEFYLFMSTPVRDPEYSNGRERTNLILVTAK